MRTGFATATGPRAENQDRGLALQARWGGAELALLGVCDGVGGDAHGARAAAEVTRALAGFLSYLPPEPDPLRNVRAVADWSRALQGSLAGLAEREALRGLSTTLVATLLWGDRGLVWWLGDSRAYLFRDGRLERLTRDHSYVEEVLGLDEEEALEHPERNVITRSVRAGHPQDPEVVEFEWREGDVVLVASDGVCGALRTAELEAFLGFRLCADCSPQELAEGLLEHLSYNLSDNATVAVAVRGCPRPFPGAAVLDVPVMARQGLSEGALARVVGQDHARSEVRIAKAAPPGRSRAITPQGAEVPLTWRGDCLELGPDTLPGDPTVSSSHATVTRGGGQLRVRDGGSDNGLWLRIEEAVLETPGSLTLRVGRHHLIIGQED